MGLLRLGPDVHELEADRRAPSPTRRVDVSRSATPLSLWFLEFRSHLDACVDKLAADRVVPMNGHQIVAHDDGLGQRVSQGGEVAGDETGKHGHPDRMPASINWPPTVLCQ